jgi:hypothetical protein
MEAQHVHSLALMSSQLLTFQLRLVCFQDVLRLARNPLRRSEAVSQSELGGLTAVDAGAKAKSSTTIFWLGFWPLVASMATMVLYLGLWLQRLLILWGYS